MKATPGTKTIKDLLELTEIQHALRQPGIPARRGVDETDEEAIGRAPIHRTALTERGRGPIAWIPIIIAAGKYMKQQGIAR